MALLVDAAALELREREVICLLGVGFRTLPLPGCQRAPTQPGKGLEHLRRHATRRSIRIENLFATRKVALSDRLAHARDERLRLPSLSGRPRDKQQRNDDHEPPTLFSPK